MQASPSTLGSAADLHLLLCTGMYNMMDADYFASFLFFVAAILIINYW